MIKSDQARAATLHSLAKSPAGGIAAPAAWGCCLPMRCGLPPEDHQIAPANARAPTAAPPAIPGHRNAPPRPTPPPPRVRSSRPVTDHSPQNRPEPTPSPSAGQVTAILSRANTDPAAAADLLPLVYGELRKLARARLARIAGPDNTLEPTALVHEAFVRLVGNADPGWNGRGHFFAAAAQAMRNILVDQARRKASIKHGGGAARAEIDPEDLPMQEPKEDIIALDAALTKLQQVDERKARIVMLRYFSGLTAEETAAALDVSVPTVHREWKLAKALLKLELAGK